jgi:hypothetical protein
VDQPVNIGYPVSTTDDNIAFQPYMNGAYGFYSIMTGYKKKEIALVDLQSSWTKRKETP